MGTTDELVLVEAAIDGVPELADVSGGLGLPTRFIGPQIISAGAKTGKTETSQRVAFASGIAGGDAEFNGIEGLPTRVLNEAAECAYAGGVLAQSKEENRKTNFTNKNDARSCGPGVNKCGRGSRSGALLRPSVVFLQLCQVALDCVGERGLLPLRGLNVGAL